jgi:hypothetical protein
MMRKNKFKFYNTYEELIKYITEFYNLKENDGITICYDYEFKPGYYNFELIKS